jgi:pyruvate,water dikinase
MLSHGAIVARDFGIPAVVLPGATKILPEGATVRIDGNKGRVELLQKEAR